MKILFILTLNLVSFLCLPVYSDHSPSHISEKSEDVLNFIKPWLPLNPQILEAGSYNGLDTVKMATHWPEGHIYTFEPIPELFQQTCNRTKSFSNISTYQLALSDKTGEATFYISEINNSEIFASSSLLPPSGMLTEAPWVAFGEITQVKTITIDEFVAAHQIPQIDFLWLDIQGSELDVIKDSQTAKKATIIYVEVEFKELYVGQKLFSDIMEWMTSNGFELAATDFYQREIEEGKPAGNALFIKSNRLKTAL